MGFVVVLMVLVPVVVELDNPDVVVADPDVLVGFPVVDPEILDPEEVLPVKV